ncbi:MAG: prepilin peptidase [Akkermansia sp.]|nr:prepilin peptidase [Akkermansia sp.]
MMELIYLQTQAITAETPWLLPLAFALFGACIGSFLNVVVYRLPRGLSVNEPSRSFCPHCKKEIPWYLNLPVISWLLLRGKSACCGQRIPVRYWLVETVCSALFALIAWYFCLDDIFTQILLCVWVALMLACFCIDWEQMVVLPSLTVAAAVAGLLLSGLAPWMVEPTALEPTDGLLWSVVGAVGGFILFRFIGWIGSLFFGRRSVRFDKATAWSLKQAADGEDIVLMLGDETMLWSDLFMEPSNRFTLRNATLDSRCDEPGNLEFRVDALLLPGGGRVELESVECLSGLAGGYVSRRAAMGSGDAWIALSIGAIGGWQGVLFALSAGSIIGLLWAAVARIGFGKPMPFGPALILAALVWLFFGLEIQDLLALWY